MRHEPASRVALETLGFEHVCDYVAGKADWLAHGLPREGTNARVPYAGDLLDIDPPVCALHDDLAAASTAVSASPYGFCLVVNDERIVLGRLRRSALEHSAPDATVEDLMDPGPSTIRANTPARDLLERLAKRNLKTAIVATPQGRLLGVFSRTEAERRLDAR